MLLVLEPGLLQVHFLSRSEIEVQVDFHLQLEH